MCERIVKPLTLDVVVIAARAVCLLLLLSTDCRLQSRQDRESGQRPQVNAKKMGPTGPPPRHE